MAQFCARFDGLPAASLSLARADLGFFAPQVMPGTNWGAQLGSTNWVTATLGGTIPVTGVSQRRDQRFRPPGSSLRSLLRLHRTFRIMALDLQRGSRFAADGI